MDEQQQDEGPQYDREEWVYLGPHHKPGLYLWRDGEGTRLAYSKLKARVFGGIYTVQVERTADNVRVVPDPVYTGRSAEDAALIQVRALVNEEESAGVRLERSTSRTAVIDEALVDILQIASKLTRESDRYALAKLVTNRIIGARR